MIDTAKVRGRRDLQFKALDDMLADARTCVACSTLSCLGNWSIGQALHHVAAWIDYPLLGYPPELVIPEDMKSQARAAKERILRAPMQPGERLPGLSAGTLATEDAPAAVGLARLEAACARLSSRPAHEPMPVADPAFGVLTRHEWTLMTLRHAELHLSFFMPGPMAQDDRVIPRGI